MKQTECSVKSPKYKRFECSSHSIVTPSVWDRIQFFWMIERLNLFNHFFGNFAAGILNLRVLVFEMVPQFVILFQPSDVFAARTPCSLEHFVSTSRRRVDWANLDIEVLTLLRQQPIDKNRPAAWGCGEFLTTPITPDPLLDGKPSLIGGSSLIGKLAVRNPSEYKSSHEREGQLTFRKASPSGVVPADEEILLQELF